MHECTGQFEHSDGYSAFVRRWQPPKPRGAVLYLHGIQSHGGWYEGSGRRLADMGYVVLMPDRRGSGRNLQDRGHGQGPQRWIDDVAELTESLRTAVAGGVHVVGVSWGGKLAAAAAAGGVAGIASLTLVAPGIFPRVDLSAAAKFRVALSLVADRHRKFAIPLDDPALFTGNPARIAFVEQDPWRLREVTGPFLVASRRLDRMAQGLPASGWHGPVHLMLAGRDAIIDNDATRQWFRRLPPGPHRLTEFHDAHHTIEFEEDPLPLYASLGDWLSGLDGGEPHGGAEAGLRA